MILITIKKHYSGLGNHSHLVEWVRPDAGALCCVRLRHDAFPDQAVGAFYAVLEAHDLQVADGTWFGEEKRVFRLGFGYLPLNDFPVALEALSQALSAASEKQSVTKRLKDGSCRDNSPGRRNAAAHAA